MSDGGVTARDVVIHGRVQGVFFRASCADEADRLGVRGWVRNDLDGTVSGHFEGPPDAVDSLVAWCRHGPRRAVVTQVQVTTGSPTGADRFLVR